MKGNLYIISSPSGAGKSTILAQLFSKYNNDNSLYLSISHTTRPKRPLEEDGVHYHFVSETEFKKLIERNAFYEWANVFDKYYGTSKEIIQEKINNGLDVFLDIDWQGAQQLRKIEPNILSIFILPPSLEELNQRLHKRAQDSEDVIKSRMEKAQREISHYNEYDYCIINDNLEESVATVWNIVKSNRNKTNNFEAKHYNLISELLKDYKKD